MAIYSFVDPEKKERKIEKRMKEIMVDDFYILCSYFILHSILSISYAIYP